jgi:AhpD family alkylhydroperoxidase
MATDTQDLSSAQKELVAVGASLGAGCHPCLDHHLQAGAQAGLDSSELLAAVATAESIASEATVLAADHAREHLRPTPATPTSLTQLEKTLAALGAALGANDAAATDLQLRSALDFGASRSQLQEAIETAMNVQESAGRIHADKAERLLDEIAPPAAPARTAAQADDGCGCGGGPKDCTDGSSAKAEGHAAATAVGGCAGAKEV